MSTTQSAGDPPPQRSVRANALVIGLGCGLLLVAHGVVMHELTTESRDAVVDADFIELASPISGQLKELKVEAGSAVQKGQQLAMVQNLSTSDADVNQLRIARITAQTRLEQLDHELSLQTRLASALARDARNQQQLELARSRNDLDQLHADLARERLELAFRLRDVKRQEELFRVGAVSETVVDQARTAVAQNHDQVRAVEAKVRAQNNRVKAAQLNLTLDRTRGNTDPQPRLQDSQLRLAQLRGDRASAQRRVKGLEAQLKTAQIPVQEQSNAWLSAPIPAVVWGVQARTGDTLRPLQPVLRLVNCASRWVTTYVSESDLKRLRIGSPARIDLVGEEMNLRGHVDLIRSGVGRLSGQNDEPIPRPINLVRESQVRVRIDSDAPAVQRKLCFVGYSARVIFQ